MHGPLPPFAALLLLCSLWPAAPLLAQSSQAPNVFLDCNRCDFSYMRRQIPFVNWVRDREDAVVHVLVTDQRTGSGGREYELQLIGLKKFAGTDEKLQYVSPQHYSEDEQRAGLAGILKIGLLPYLKDTPLISRVSISYQEAGGEEAAPPVADPWDSWVFEVEGGGWLEVQDRRREFSLDGSLSADRITEEWSIRTRLWGEYEQDRFKREEGIFTSSSHERQFWSSVVKSLGPHWSAGADLRAYSNTFDNTDLGLRLASAAEYSFFDYAESERRSLTLAYRVGPRYRDYAEQTIYGKTSEALFDHSLDVDLRLNRPWGSARLSIEGSHFFHDVRRYRVEVFGNFSVRIARGLSLNARGSVDRINDQLSLPRGDATLEEILLRRRALATNYEAWVRVGLSYTFGSIYNNVVNTRL